MVQEVKWIDQATGSVSTESKFGRHSIERVHLTGPILCLLAEAFAHLGKLACALEVLKVHCFTSHR